MDGPFPNRGPPGNDARRAGDARLATRGRARPRLHCAVIGHLLAFVLFCVVYGAFRLVAGHGMGIVPSLVVSVPCEVAGVIAGRSVKRWMAGY